jgi:hypothetical protein
MEGIAGDRAVLAYEHDEEGALYGAQLISAETDPDVQREQDIFIFIKGNFAAFLNYLRNLSLRDQELLLAYYCLRKTQTLLAPFFQTSQTLCSARMRAAVRAMCAYIVFGGQPTEERMRPILQAVGAEKASLSTGQDPAQGRRANTCRSREATASPGGGDALAGAAHRGICGEAQLSQARGRARHPSAGDQARFSARGREAGSRRQRAAGARRVDSSDDRQGEPFRGGREQAASRKVRRRLRQRRSTHRRLPRPDQQEQLRPARPNFRASWQPMTPLQRKWDDILASHGLPAVDGGDTALNRAMFFGNPDSFEEEDDDFSTFMDTIEEPNPWVLERPPLILPVRTVTPEELKAMDGGGCVMWTFTDQRTKRDRYRYSSEVQAARFRGKHHPEDVKQKMRATALRIWADPNGVRLARPSGNSAAGRSASRDAPARSTETAKG